MPKKQITSAHYQRLLTSVRHTIVSGLIAAQKSLEYQRLKTYWEVGREIRRVVDRSDGVLVPGEKLYQRISRDLNKSAGMALSVDTVGRMVQFHKNYPRFPMKTPLTFTHYIALQRVRDPEKRARLEERAIRKNMSALEIKAAVLAMRAAGSPFAEKEKGRLAFERGEPYVYATIVNTDIHRERDIVVDCGFRINIDLPEDNPYRPKQSRIVRSLKHEGRYRIIEPKDKDLLRYTYAAFVTRVVDGDTFDARIDVGFGIHLNDRLRLRGIDAPEINTQAGKVSADFLKKKLATAPVIVIRTSKSGMYGRWLADIFLLPKCDDSFRIAAEGEYLNQRLLDEGLARVYDT